MGGMEGFGRREGWKVPPRASGVNPRRPASSRMRVLLDLWRQRLRFAASLLYPSIPHPSMLNRRQFVSRTAAAGLALPFAPLARASAPSARTARGPGARGLAASPRGAAAFEEIRRGVGFFTERGGTIGYLATDGALVMVDTQFPEQARTAYDGLDERTPGRASVIDLLINTHHHGDHTSGNVAVAPLAARHVAHEAVPGLQRAAAVKSGSLEAQAYPRETYDGTWSTDVGDETITLRYFGPAHTCGDSVVHFENADVVHMGDLVFNRIPPYIDLGAGASTENWMRVLERPHGAFSDETRFIFGHGDEAHGVTGTRADLLVMRDFLGATREYVRTGLASGESAEALAQIEAIPGFPDHTGQRLSSVIQIVAEEMQR